MGIEKRALGIACLPLDERKGEIAAEDHAAGAADTVVQTRGHRADAGDRHDAERDAGDKNAEAAQAAAQIAPDKAHRKAPRNKPVCLWIWRQHQFALGITRARRKCNGANTKTGIPSNNPANQMYGGSKVCGAVSRSPQT